VSDFLTTFSGQRIDDQGWRFDLQKQFNGAFGGTNGGVLSAVSLYAARTATGRRPASLDSRYLRGFRPGTARVLVSPLNEGRSVSVLGVDVVDDEDRLCTHSVVTLVEQTALATEISQTGHIDPPDNLSSFAEGKRWTEPRGMEIPLISTFEPAALGGQGLETTTATRVIWSEPGTAAEAACIAADISVGPPVARAVRGAASTPNPDLSLRFCGHTDPGQHLAASCHLEAIVNGLASTQISVWNEDELLAIGISTTTCLPLARSDR
jgi:acyl-coenzyme A thioesterase PaaI-like protein